MAELFRPSSREENSTIQVIMSENPLDESTFQYLNEKLNDAPDMQSFIQSALGSDDKNDKGFTICVHKVSPVEISPDTLEYSIREFGKPYSHLQISSSSPVPDSPDLNSSSSRRQLPAWQTMIDFLTERGPSPTQDIDIHDTQKSDRVVSRNLEHDFNIAPTLC
jgi:hypothetical protein